MDIAELLQQGRQYQTEGNLAQAKACFEQALQEAPAAPEALYAMGMLAFQAQHPETGLQYLIRAVNHGGTEIDLFRNLARVLHGEGNPQDAIKALSRGLQLHPADIPALTMLGKLLRETGDLEKSHGVLMHATKAAPEHADGFLELARTASQLGRLELADASFSRALSLEPSVHAHNDYASFLISVGQDEQALRQYQAAVELAPDARSVMINMGFHLYTMGRPQESLAAFDKSLEAAPNDPDSHALRAFPLLLEGRFTEGWKEYEWRLQCPSFPQLPVATSSPPWRGEALDGKTILVIAEQGYGDTFQFVRYAQLLADRGARVILAAQTPALEVLKTAPGVDDAVPYDAPVLPDHDVHIHIMSLPERFATTLETVPADVPYLHADPGLAAMWQERLSSHPGRRVGIVWSGNPAQRNNRKRSCPLSTIAPLAQIPGITLFSLAKDRPAAEGPLPDGMIDLGGDLQSFSDTAAIMANLDLVISVCTSAAHMSGALGRPTWVMLAAASDWRWLMGRDDNPWYPTARLFRQKTLHDWDGLVSQIAQELGDL